MTRSIRRLVALGLAMGALLAVSAAPAQASEEALRERTHARVSAILNAAVEAELFSVAQENYVTSALLPTYVDPKVLSPKVEERLIEDFWDAVTSDTGVGEGQAKARLANGASLLRITGVHSEMVQDRLSRWLVRPVIAAMYQRQITPAEAASLREDIERAIDRLMRQPGGSDGKVVVSPRHN
jgi:hypothetical protein